LSARYLLSEALNQLRDGQKLELDMNYVESTVTLDGVDAFVRKLLGLVVVLHQVNEGRTKDAIANLEALESLCPESKAELRVQKGLIYLFTLEDWEKAVGLEKDIFATSGDSTDVKLYRVVLT